MEHSGIKTRILLCLLWFPRSHSIPAFLWSACCRVWTKSVVSRHEFDGSFTIELARAGEGWRGRNAEKRLKINYAGTRTARWRETTRRVSIKVRVTLIALFLFRMETRRAARRGVTRPVNGPFAPSRKPRERRNIARADAPVSLENARIRGTNSMGIDCAPSPRSQYTTHVCARRFTLQ